MQENPLYEDCLASVCEEILIQRVNHLVGAKCALASHVWHRLWQFCALPAFETGSLFSGSIFDYLDPVENSWLLLLGLDLKTAGLKLLCLEDGEVFTGASVWDFAELLFHAQRTLSFDMCLAGRLTDEFPVLRAPDCCDVSVVEYCALLGEASLVAAMIGHFGCDCLDFERLFIAAAYGAFGDSSSVLRTLLALSPPPRKMILRCVPLRNAHGLETLLEASMPSEMSDWKRWGVAEAVKHRNAALLRLLTELGAEVGGEQRWSDE